MSFKITDNAQPIPAEFQSATDGVTIGGLGTGPDPLHAIPGGIGIVHDGTLHGDGTTDLPLGTVPDKTPVLTDGTTIVGTGVTGDPLIATGGTPSSVFVQPFTYTVTGVEADPANLVIPVSPAQPDGAYIVAMSQGAGAFFYVTRIDTQVGGSFVLHVSFATTAGDKFNFVLTRPAP